MSNAGRCSNHVWIGLFVSSLALVGCKDEPHGRVAAPEQRSADSGSSTEREGSRSAESTRAQLGDDEPAQHLETYINKPHQFHFSYPQGWSVMSPAEVREKTGGLLKPSPAALVFVVHDGNPDMNVNLLFTGDAAREAPNNKAARRFLEKFSRQYPSVIRQQFPGARVVSTRVCDLAGGVAFEAVYNVPRGQTPMKQKSVMVIVSGKAYTITCTSPAAEYDEADHSGFKPIIDTLTFEQ